MNWDAILDKSVDELDRELGTFLLKEGLESHEPSDEFKKKVGQSWFDDQKKKLAQLLCPQQFVVTHLRDKAKQEQRELAALIFDVLSSHYTQLPVATIAARIVHFGVDRLCEGHCSEGK